ncbi:MAG: hypothetical protein V9H26_26670 [Verrucomicrobiota bacterium]
MPLLTAKQQALADFIESHRRRQGHAPTYQEIAGHFGFRSENAVTGHLRLMRQKGYLASDSGKARSLRVTSPLAKLRSRIVDIPLLGAIPAGFPEDGDSASGRLCHGGHRQRWLHADAEHVCGARARCFHDRPAHP